MLKDAKGPFHFELALICANATSFVSLVLQLGLILLALIHCVVSFLKEVCISSFRNRRND